MILGFVMFSTKFVHIKFSVDLDIIYTKVKFDLLSFCKNRMKVTLVDRHR